MRKNTRSNMHTIEGAKGEQQLAEATANLVAAKLGGEAGVTDGAYDDEIDFAIYNTTATIKEFSEAYAAALELLRKKGSEITDCVAICEDYNLEGEQLDQVSNDMYFGNLTLRQALKVV